MDEYDLMVLCEDLNDLFGSDDAEVHISADGVVLSLTDEDGDVFVGVGDHVDEAYEDLLVALDEVE